MKVVLNRLVDMKLENSKIQAAVRLQLLGGNLSPGGILPYRKQTALLASKREKLLDELQQLSGLFWDECAGLGKPELVEDFFHQPGILSRSELISLEQLG